MDLPHPGLVIAFVALVALRIMAFLERRKP